MRNPLDPAASSPRHPGLDAVIRAARRQSAPVVGVTVEDIRAASSARSHARWWVGLAAVAVAVVSIAAFQSRHADPDSESSTHSSRVAAATDVPPQTPKGSAERSVVEPGLDSVDPAPLAVATVRPLEGAEEVEPDERGVVALRGGRYRIQTAGESMMVSVAGRVLEISAASDVVVDARVKHSSFTVHRGDAVWSRSNAPHPQPRPGAKQLANEAEAALLSGRRDEAARLLRKLVQAHPRGPVSKAALIDLARLEKRLDRPDRAHCAYALFAKRFPTDARTPTVRRADDALARSPLCRGLRPVSK